MNSNYPPFKITKSILLKIENINKTLEKINIFNIKKISPILRKQNRIKSIHSSCAIEANSLTINEVTDIINNNVVIGPKNEILEVKNAINAYNIIEDIDPFDIKSLLKIHKILTTDLIQDAGKFRKGEEGVFDGDKCIFIAPSKRLLNQLINNLYIWLNQNRYILNPFILVSIFHYEFVFIHPFSDGNGRTIRLLVNSILSKYYSIFLWIPIENFIQKNQSKYYEAISKSHTAGELSQFIEFMLEMINESLNELILDLKKEQLKNDIFIKKILNLMKKNTFYTIYELLDLLRLKSKENLRKNYINPAIEKGYISLEYPNKRTSKRQRYIKI